MQPGAVDLGTKPMVRVLNVLSSMVSRSSLLLLTTCLVGILPLATATSSTAGPSSEPTPVAAAAARPSEDHPGRPEPGMEPKGAAPHAGPGAKALAAATEVDPAGHA